MLKTGAGQDKKTVAGVTGVPQVLSLASPTFTFQFG